MARIGAIADDLTGATDLALALTSAGYRTSVALDARAPANDPLGTGGEPPDAIVVALKSRTAPADAAVAESLEALARLLRDGCERFYVKYCSTFDSTPAGNIGPVSEAVLDALGESVTVVAPAFPANGRTVYRGHLFVGDDPLDESPMRHHPLTPMSDSSLPRLLAPQVSGGAADVALVRWPVVDRGADAVRAAIAAASRAGARFVVVDALSDADLATLAQAAGGLRLLTGGSALAGTLSGPRASGHLPLEVPAGPRIVLSGSASLATRAQVRHAIAVGDGVRLRAADLRERPDAVVAEAADRALASDAAPFVVYATAAAEHVADPADAPLVEQALAGIAQRIVAAGTRALVVAGGETSGAVMHGLGVRSLAVGPEVDPGVAWTLGQRVDGDDLHLVLKSGNFGGEDLFVRAWEAGR